MRIRSVRGKLLQLCQGRLPIWPIYLNGWLKRRKTGVVPCIIASSDKLLYIPLKDFYESYEFFYETPAGKKEIGFFLAQLKKSEVVYDVGAFRGAYSATTKIKLCDEVIIHAFEALRQNVESIERIRQLNEFENFVITPQAVGKGSLLTGNISDRDAMLRLGDTDASLTGVTFASISIDEYIARGNPVPTLLKIDVDGFELEVLEGATRCLGQDRPRLWIEVHPTFLAAQKKSPDDLLHLLEGAGYTISFFRDYSPRSSAPYHIWCV